MVYETFVQLYELSLALKHLHGEGLVHGDLHGVRGRSQYDKTEITDQLCRGIFSSTTMAVSV